MTERLSTHTPHMNTSLHTYTCIYVRVWLCFVKNLVVFSFRWDLPFLRIRFYSEMLGHVPFFFLFVFQWDSLSCLLTPFGSLFLQLLSRTWAFPLIIPSPFWPVLLLLDFSLNLIQFSQAKSHRLTSLPLSLGCWALSAEIWQQCQLKTLSIRGLQSVGAQDSLCNPWLFHTFTTVFLLPPCHLFPQSRKIILTPVLLRPTGRNSLTSSSFTAILYHYLQIFSTHITF